MIDAQHKGAWQMKNIILACLVVFSLGGCGGSQTGTTSSNETKTAEPAIKVTANELLAAYNENEVAGDEKYKGKTLEVSGKIDDIQAGIGDDKFVLLKAGKDMEFNKPQAHFAASETSKISTLKKGAEIKLKCVGDGEVMKSPMLKDCTII